MFSSRRISTRGGSDLDANSFLPDSLDAFLRYQPEVVIKPSVQTLVKPLRVIEASLKKDCMTAEGRGDVQATFELFLLRDFFHNLSGPSEIGVCWIEYPPDEDGPVYGGVDFGKCLIGMPIFPGREINWLQRELSVFVPLGMTYGRLGSFQLVDGAESLKGVLTRGCCPDKKLICHDSLPVANKE